MCGTSTSDLLSATKWWPTNELLHMWTKRSECILLASHHCLAGNILMPQTPGLHCLTTLSKSHVCCLTSNYSQWAAEPTSSGARSLSAWISTISRRNLKFTELSPLRRMYSSKTDSVMSFVYDGLLCQSLLVVALVTFLWLANNWWQPY